MTLILTSVKDNTFIAVHIIMFILSKLFGEGLYESIVGISENCFAVY